MSWLFISGSQSTGARASASVLPMNIQDWFLSQLTDLISLQPKELSRDFFSTTIWKHQLMLKSAIVNSPKEVYASWQHCTRKLPLRFLVSQPWSKPYVWCSLLQQLLGIIGYCCSVLSTCSLWFSVKLCCPFNSIVVDLLSDIWTQNLDTLILENIVFKH